MNVSGRLEVFAVGGWATIYHAWQLAGPEGGAAGPSSAAASRAASRSAPTPPVASRSSTAAATARCGTSGSRRRLAWSAPASLGGTLAGSPLATRNRDGRLEIFAPLANRVPGHIWQKSPGGAWSAWAAFKGPAAAALAGAAQTDGHLVVFDLGTDTVIYRNLQLV